MTFLLIFIFILIFHIIFIYSHRIKSLLEYLIKKLFYLYLYLFYLQLEVFYQNSKYYLFYDFS